MQALVGDTGDGPISFCSIIYELYFTNKVIAVDFIAEGGFRFIDTGFRKFLVDFVDFDF